MASAFNRDLVRLELISRLIASLERRLKDLPREAMFADDRDELDLTAYRLGIIGENTNKLSPLLKARHPEIDWARAYQLRNIVAHDYDAIDPVRIWRIAGEHLDELATMCRVEIALLDS